MTSIYASWNYQVGSRYSGFTRPTEQSADIDSPAQNTGRGWTSAPSFGSNPSPATAKLQDRLSVLDVEKLDHSTLVPINVAGLPEDKHQIFMEQQQQLIAANTRYLENRYTEHVLPDLSSDPRQKDYATIVVGGKIVAEIDNQGVVTSYDDYWGKRITDLLNSDPAELAGTAAGPATGSGESGNVLGAVRRQDRDGADSHDAAAVRRYASFPRSNEDR